MAGKLVLSAGNAAGMPFFYNVSKHVGPFKDNPNDPDDVQLVQFLIREGLKAKPPSAARSGLAIPTLSGQFDPTTGFWISLAQQSFRSKPGVTIDGIVSPARGQQYHPGCPWVIFSINLRLFEAAPKVFLDLPNNPELRPSLRASLK
jgi:hypothetical protein